MKIEKGHPAPGFILRDTDKNEIALKDQRGKNVVLLFFPLAFTSVCTAELCNVRDNIADYNAANAQVYGISVDAPATLMKFKQDQGLNFPLLSDFNKEVSTSFGAIYEQFAGWMKGVSKRAAFVIDKEGMVQYAEVLENAKDLPNFDAIQNTLKGLN